MKIGRNNPCPCGSGLKYKKCCADQQQAGRTTGGSEDVMQEMQEALAGESFQSIDQANAAVEPFLEDAFLRVFPMLLEEAAKEETYFFSAEKALRSCYSLSCLESFAGFLGLSEISRGSDFRNPDFITVRKLPLLNQVVRFHL